jgi:SAM-dependent methyltransferase
MEAAEYGLMDAAEDRMWWYRALHARLLRAIAGAEGPLLDAGCGTGGFLARLPAGLPAIGMDYHPPAAARAARKAQVPAAAGSINALPFADASFGVAVSADVLSHGAADPRAALAELFRVLRPGGRLVLNLPAFRWLLSAHDLRVHNTRRFTAPELRDSLAAAGFEAVRTRYWNGLLLPLMVLQRKLLARRAESRSDVATFPPWQDRMFFAATEIERTLPFALPAGGSVLAIARKPMRP